MPIPGATVAIRSLPGQLFSDTTDGDGAFSIQAPAGLYELFINGTKAAAPEAYIPDTFAVSPVRPGGELISLFQDRHEELFVRAYPITFTFRNERTDAAVPGVAVNATAQGITIIRTNSWMPAAEMTHTVTTGPDGVAVVPVLENIAVTVTGTPPADSGLATTTVPPFPIDWDTSKTVLMAEVPPAPAGLMAVSPTRQSPALSWDAVAGANHYVVYRDGTAVGTTTDASFIDEGLSVDGSYRYEVSAVSDPGHEGPTSPDVLVLYDTTAPSVAEPELSVNPKPADGTSQLSAAVSDVGSGVGGGEYFIGATDPGPGQATPMEFIDGSLRITIGTDLPPGTYPLNVRAHDLLGNWSAVATTTLTVSDPNLADLTVAVSTSEPAWLGGTYALTLTVTNDGPREATEVSTATAFAGDARLVLDADASQGTCTVDAEVTCALSTLAAGTTATVTVIVEPQALGTVIASSSVQAGLPDPQAENNVAVTTTPVTNGYGCTIIGTPGNDTIRGTDGDEVICALGGDDTIVAGRGDDTVYAGSGDDVVDGGIGTDVLYGGWGDDTLNGEAGKDTILGGDGNDAIDGGNGDDSLFGGPGDDVIDGGAGHDVIDGGPGDNELTGGPGDDTITGGDGVDLIDAGTGHDVINSGGGADVIWAGGGNDTVSAGEGDDIIYGGSGSDTIDGGPGVDTADGENGTNTCTATEYLTRCTS